MSELRALKDCKSGKTEYWDLSTGRTYHDAEGLKLSREMSETEWLLGEGGKPMRLDGRMIHASTLANMAAEHYYQQVAEQVGHAVSYKMRDEGGSEQDCVATPRKAAVTMRDRNGKLVAMDLSIADVHTNAALPNYAAGYHIADGIADVVSPVLLVPKASNVYWTWNTATDFQRKIPNAGAPGTDIGNVNPAGSFSTYTCVQYQLGGYLPTEIQANADVPLQPMVKLMQMVVDGLRLEREYRVATLAQTSGSWNTNVVTTIAAGAQWNGGGASDPIKNLHTAIEASYLPVTGIAWSELVEHDFLRNPAVQKYFTFKDMINGIPDPLKLSSTLRLPPIHTAMMKYSVGSTLPYVWGNHVVLFHNPPQIPPTSQMDVSSELTFRWMGGDAPDGHVASGLLVRTFFDPKQGARGSTRVVCVHDDFEAQTSAYAGALLINAHQ